ncbi:DHHA1 domain-containing protein [candidate division KSB1 bacterium]
MTERIYYRDPYAAECTARVLRTESVQGRGAVILDRTCFYPASGGQLNDTGTINGIPVIDVFEQGETVYHIIGEGALEEENVRCRIDWERRFDHMQQHTGQHILSQCFIKTIDAETVSSSLGSEICTIDIDCPSLTPEDAFRTEKEANYWVYKNAVVAILYPTDEELAKLPLRKPPPSGKEIRIIHIDGLDYSPCGGTHCTHTGEVGIIKIRRWEKMRGNTRIEFICGARALNDYREKMRLTGALSSSLSTAEQDIGSAIDRLMKESKSQLKTIRELRNELFAFKAGGIYESAEQIKNIRVTTAALSSDNFADLKLQAQQIRNLGTGIVLVTNDGPDPMFVFTRSEDIEIDLNNILSDLQNDYQIKGGGSPGMVQGVLDNESETAGFLQKARESVIQRIG